MSPCTPFQSVMVLINGSTLFTACASSGRKGRKAAVRRPLSTASAPIGKPNESEQSIEFPAKLTDIEAQRMCAKSVRIPAHRLKTENCLCQTRDILLVKENPCSPLNNRFQSAPARDKRS